MNLVVVSHSTKIVRGVANLPASKSISNRLLLMKAVAGFDDNTHFSLFSPAITAVAQPVQEISETVIKKLIARLSGKEKLSEKETIVLPVKLIVRESSLPRKKK